MRIGVVFPQTEIGSDADVISGYAQRVERMGDTHVLAYDHVLGADPEGQKGWNAPYDGYTTFHAPCVVLSSGSAPSRSWRTGASAGSPTDGSRRCRRARASTMPVRLSSRPHGTRDGIPPHWAWKAA